MNFFILAIIKNLNNLTDESSNGNINSLNVSNKYKDLLQPCGYIYKYFCNLPGNIKPKNLSIFHHMNVCSFEKFDQLHALLAKPDIDFDFIGITKSCIRLIFLQVNKHNS